MKEDRLGKFLISSDNPFQSRVAEGRKNIVPELQLNKTHTSDTEAPFWICIYLFQMDLFHLKFMISAMTLILIQ